MTARRFNSWKDDKANSRRRGPRKDPNNWVPHKGPFKLIKLPPNAGITPETTDANGKHIVRTQVHKEDW